MLAIARALMLRPSLLLLDEPSFGLAPLIVADIFRILRAINRDDRVSMLIVEQNANPRARSGRPRLSDRDRPRRDRRPGERDPQRRFGAPRLSRLLRGASVGRVPASVRFRARARRHLCHHGARAGDDLPGDASGEFRAGRDGDVLDLFRLEADRLRLALLARIRRDGRSSRSSAASRSSASS